MPRLVLLNGAPGVGKTTLARRWAADRPLTLVLDVDDVRAQLSGWAQDPIVAGLAARDIAVAMALTHLQAGHDVVVAQFLARPEFGDRLRALSDATESAFVEILLTTPQVLGRARFDARGDVAQVAGATETFDEAHARFVDYARDRVDAVRVDAGGDPDATAAAVQRAVRAACG